MPLEIIKLVYVISSLGPFWSDQEPHFLKAWKTSSSAITLSVSVLPYPEGQVPLPVLRRRAGTWDKNTESHGDSLPLRASESNLDSKNCLFLSVSPFSAPSVVKTQGPPGPHQMSIRCLPQMSSCSSCSKMALPTETHLGQNRHEASGNQQEYGQADSARSGECGGF